MQYVKCNLISEPPTDKQFFKAYKITSKLLQHNFSPGSRLSQQNVWFQTEPRSLSVSHNIYFAHAVGDIYPGKTDH